MHYPSFGEYTDALQLGLDRALADPLLRHGTLRTLAPGQPLVRGGTFALTFEVATDSGRYALRCFHKELDALPERYAAIQDCLAQTDSPCFVNPNFQPEGITTESGIYPIVRMDWAEGASLAAYVAQHRDNPDTLQQLRLALRHLAAQLDANRIAHGDLQPSNIIVQRDASLRLVDYDGMFVPGLDQYGSAELGQRNFQHPGRRSWHFDARLDRFSLAVLDLALDALRTRPELWDLTRSGEDAFLLRAIDFAGPANSPVFALLARERGLEQRVQHLAALCAAPFEQTPSFENFLAGRQIPIAPARHADEPGARERPAYLSPYPLVNGADFAQCCRHVGDRVELVGRGVRVVRDAATSPGSNCLRVEFGDPAADTACLRFWPDLLPGIDAAPDEDWVDEWISAVGLVEPVYDNPEGAQRKKYVSITITEMGQLHRLSEAEAKFRLDSQVEWAGRLDDMAVVVRTEPVVPEAEAPAKPPAPAVAVVEVTPSEIRPTVEEPAPPPGETRLAPMPVAISATRARSRRRLVWATSIALAALTLYLTLSFWAAREPTSSTGDSVDGAAAGATPADSLQVVNVEVRPVPAVLMSQQKLRAATTSLETTGGILRLRPAETGACGQVAVLNESIIDGLCDEVIELAHHTVYSDRDVVVGFTRCGDAAAPCGQRRPFWLELRPGVPPAVRRMPGLWAGSAVPVVSASKDRVQVDFGPWNGERRVVALTASGNVVVARARLLTRPLSRQHCADVIQALERCAASRDCSSLAGSAQRIPPAQRARLDLAYHETTGLDAEAFRRLCVRSCELGLTPSRALIRRYACNGAAPGQWPADDPAAGLLR